MRAGNFVLYKRDTAADGVSWDAGIAVEFYELRSGDLVDFFMIACAPHHSGAAEPAQQMVVFQHGGARSRTPQAHLPRRALCTGRRPRESDPPDVRQGHLEVTGIALQGFACIALQAFACIALQGFACIALQGFACIALQLVRLRWCKTSPGSNSSSNSN